MPIYEYKCKSDRCGIKFESISKPWESKGVKCPKCKVSDCIKVISAPGGYNIKGNNSASVRPKSAGSFKKG